MKEIALSALPSEVLPGFLHSKKLLMVVGAGISTSSGIPDFRGSNGIYTKNKNAAQDLFDSTIAFQSPESTATFYSFISQLSSDISRAVPTPTHHFMAAMNRRGKLLRVYSQNIDYLEARAGLQTGIDKLSKVVPLHGELDKVVCTLCQHTEDLTADIRLAYGTGSVPSCPLCDERNDLRESSGKRRGKSGRLRPAIVLYNEPHPRGVQVAELVMADLRRGPDMLLVMGTSLKVPGCKKLVKDAAQEVRARGGLAVFVNASPVSASEWDETFDFYVNATTDEFCALVGDAVDAHEDRKEMKRKLQAAKAQGIGKENSQPEASKNPKTKPSASKTKQDQAEKDVLEALTSLKPFSESPAGGTVSATDDAPTLSSQPYSLRTRKSTLH